MSDEEKDITASDSDVTVDTVGLIAEQDVTPHAGDDAAAENPSGEEADEDEDADSETEDDTGEDK